MVDARANAERRVKVQAVIEGSMMVYSKAAVFVDVGKPVNWLVKCKEETEEKEREKEERGRRS